MTVQVKHTISKKHLVFGILGIILFALAAVPGIYFYIQYQKAQNQLNNPSIKGEKEIEDVVKSVAKLMMLPAGETPTLATVSDKEKLAREPFFKNALNGDKVLIYPKAKKAIIYRPSNNLIVEVAPLNISEPSTTNTASESAQQKQNYQVAIYNGTNTVGLTSVLEKILTEASPELKVTSKENAKAKDYKKTYVIDLTGKSAGVAKQIAGIVKGEVSTLPKGEVKPKNADILVIVGLQPKATVEPTSGVTEVPTIEPSPTVQP